MALNVLNVEDFDPANGTLSAKVACGAMKSLRDESIRLRRRLNSEVEFLIMRKSGLRF